MSGINANEAIFDARTLAFVADPPTATTLVVRYINDDDDDAHDSLKHLKVVIPFEHSGRSRFSHVRVDETCSTAASIAGKFLANFTSLVSVDVSALTNVTNIGPSFCTGCSALREVDLSAFGKVEAIDDWFLSRTAVVNLDLSPLVSLTAIADGFASNNSELLSCNLTGLRSLKKTGIGFFESCGALTSVDLTHLTALTEIGASFFARCERLKTVITSDASVASSPTSRSPLRRRAGALGLVKRIGGGFFDGCIAVSHLDLSTLRNVEKFEGSGFLRDCASIKCVDLSACCLLKSVGEDPFEGCGSLTQIIVPRDSSSSASTADVHSSPLWALLHDHKDLQGLCVLGEKRDADESDDEQQDVASELLVEHAIAPTSVIDAALVSDSPAPAAEPRAPSPPLPREPSAASPAPPSSQTLPDDSAAEKEPQPAPAPPAPPTAQPPVKAPRKSVSKASLETAATKAPTAKKAAPAPPAGSAPTAKSASPKARAK